MGLSCAELIKTTGYTLISPLLTVVPGVQMGPVFLLHTEAIFFGKAGINGAVTAAPLKYEYGTAVGFRFHSILKPEMSGFESRDHSWTTPIKVLEPELNQQFQEQQQKIKHI